ncbi:MAG: PTS sugar transporter subunit IIA [Planctomycetes bacterium]|nr:PTS sugar transporter subunit IIA [Planctomycetota bacterium]
MNFRRFLRPECIALSLETRAVPDEELPEDFDPDDERNVSRVREEIIQEIAGLLENSGEVNNGRRLFRDLYNREKRAITAVGQGIAIPHVRTLQVKSFVMAFGRSVEGVPFGAPDGEPVHLFFAMAAPPYEDRTYLKVYKSLAKALLSGDTIERFLTTEDPNDILFLLKNVS